MKIFATVLAALLAATAAAWADPVHIEVAPTSAQRGLTATFTVPLTEASVMGAPVTFRHRVNDADVAGEMRLTINGNVVPAPLGEGSLASGQRIPGRADTGWEDWIVLQVDRAFFNYAGDNVIAYAALRAGSSYSVTGIVIDYQTPESLPPPPCPVAGLDALAFDDPLCVEPPPAPSLPTPSAFTRLAAQLVGTPWQLPDCWPQALALGDWRAKVRTYSTPDRWYAGLWCRDTGDRYGFSGEWPEVQRFLAQQRAAAPETTRVPFDVCETAFLWATDDNAIIRACSYAYTSSTTATQVPVYASPTSTRRVGSITKGLSCSPFKLSGPAVGANQFWFEVTAEDTGVVGFARCRNTGY